MKKKFFLVLAILGLIVIGGCDEDNKKQGTLSAPQQVEVKLDGDRSIIVFDEVENAEYYSIYINDMSVTVKGGGSGTVTYDASKIMTTPQKYTIKVKAGGGEYYESGFSNVCEYEHKAMLATPVISIDGTTLNWNKIPNADFYDILVTSNSTNMQTSYRFANNKFNFSGMLTSKGEYSFKVKAISEDSQYLTSTYSNEVKYQHVQTLITPYKVQVNVNQNGQATINFISSEGVTDFVVDIDGTLYTLPQEMSSRYMIDSGYDNLYIIDLTSFLRYNNIIVDNSKQVTIKVQSVANHLYLRNSGFSEAVVYQYKSVLATPTISIVKGDATSTIKFDYPKDYYLSGFEIYLNESKYKSIPNNITSLELANSDIRGYAIRLKAISNNNNCYSSILSNAVYVDAYESLAVTNIAVANNLVTWDAVESAEKYYIEMYNKTYSKAVVVAQNSLDLSQYVDYGKYNIKVIAMGYNYESSISESVINYSQTLGKVENLEMGVGADIRTLTFDQVDGAYGYVIYLHGVKINHVFNENSININSYISEAASYNIKVQAISTANAWTNDGEISDEHVLQNTKTLTAPKLSIEEDEGRYYLNVEVNEDEKALATGCSVWINYNLLGTLDFKNSKIDITSYFTSAGNYNFMAQVVANESNPYLKDSNIVTVSRAIIKQLDMVTNIKVQKYEEEGRYILTFDEQTLVAKYEVKIVKADNSLFEKKFELNSGFGDISRYINDNGTYKVYVKAIALDNSYYTDSATASNPYIFTKGTTLGVVEEIQIVKTSVQTIYLRWGEVENALGYKVGVYYVDGLEERLVLSTTTQECQIDLGAGDHKCLVKEGGYIIKIKALGDGKEYESSSYSTYSYNYTMISASDYKRNNVFMYGSNYDYYVESFDELQHLLWYHYLYNKDVWKHSETISYNLKLYCGQNLDTMAQNYSEVLYNQIKDLEGNESKMSKLGEVALATYPEIANYTLGEVDQYGNQVQEFCINRSNATSIYFFRYVDLLNADRIEAVESTITSFPDKVRNVDTFEQRASNYVFAVDKLNAINVTTSEQLFMALQYGKRPNFVGDSSVAENIYENARQVLRQICSDNMSDYEKVCQIYDYLSVCIPYNNTFIIENISDQIATVNGGSTYAGNIRDSYLEGVFYSNPGNSASANSDGLSKAFVAMCAIEGIQSLRVIGSIDGVKHSWNKVCISIDNESSAEWYSLDIARSKTSFEYAGTSYPQFNNITFDVGTHTYFLVTDVYLSENLAAKEEFSHVEAVSAATDYDYYKNTNYSYAKYNVSGNLKHNTSNQIESEIKSLMTYSMLMTNKQADVKRYSIIAEFDISTGGLNASTFVTYIAQYYSAIRGDSILNGDYNCDSVQAFAFGNKLIILFHNYT